jgi:hypothetical protein
MGRKRNRLCVATLLAWAVTLGLGQQITHPTLPAVPTTPTITPLLADSNHAPQPSQTLSPRGAPAEIFKAVADGLNAGTVATIVPHLAPQVYISLRAGEQGYFSPNQSYYLLDFYLRSTRLCNLKFTTTAVSATTPFATGSATIMRRGKREQVQVYVSLAPAGGGWCIAQLNIH